MSDTPRTDAHSEAMTNAKVPQSRSWPYWYNFARQLERELAEAWEANDGLKLRLGKVREKLNRELAEAQGNAAALKDFENYCRVSIRRTLDDVGAPFLHPDIGAPARKPMMPTERIKALAEQRDEARQQRATLAEALESVQGVLNPLSGFTKIKGQRYLEIVRGKVREALASVKGGAES
jgi:chromosome segregation ATPase